MRIGPRPESECHGPLRTGCAARRPCIQWRLCQIDQRRWPHEGMTVTIELFRADPYRQEFMAQVTRRLHQQFILDQTCFAPQGLHSPTCDQGMLGHHEVVDVVTEGGGAPLHGVVLNEDAPPIAVGDPVIGKINWQRRYAAMKVHTAHHLAEIAVRETHDVAGISALTSGDDPLTLEIVLATGSFDTSAVRDWITSAIRDDLPMTVTHEAEVTRRWVWHLDGYGHRYCDGLHVGSTGEVGVVNIESWSNGTAAVHLLLDVCGSDIPTVS